MTEIDSIIEEIQETARNLAVVHAPEDADRKLLELMLRLAWKVKQLDRTGGAGSYRPDPYWGTPHLAEGES